MLYRYKWDTYTALVVSIKTHIPRIYWGKNVVNCTLFDTFYYKIRVMKEKAVKTVPNSTKMTAFKRDSNTEIFRFDFSLDRFSSRGKTRDSKLHRVEETGKQSNSSRTKNPHLNRFLSRYTHASLFSQL